MSLSTRTSRWMAALCLCLLTSLPALAQQPVSRVFLNGVPTPVFFNDGDTFKILSGPYTGSNVRLAGFNTLESYGPAHQWGGWDARELYFVAKMATLNARRGVWHCQSDLKRDTYGRLLAHCPDLALNQIRKGLAHALSINQEPSRADYLEAQHEAMAAHRGMWAHGVPEYVLTSVHSAAEGGGPSGHTYNRVVSTRDGHSLRWSHTDRYKECEDVCFSEFRLEPESVKSAIAGLRAHPELSERLKPYPDGELEELFNEYVKNGRFEELRFEADAGPLEAAIKQLQAEGRLGTPVSTPPVCMQYTDYTRRFGAGKAPCLKVH